MKGRGFRRRRRRKKSGTKRRAASSQGLIYTKISKGEVSEKGALKEGCPFDRDSTVDVSGVQRF